MTDTNYYTDGTISVTNGSANFTGAGTAWLTAGIRAGDKVLLQGLVARVATITAEGTGTFAVNWPGTTAAGAAYAIEYLPDVSRSTNLLAQLVALLGAGISAAFAALTAMADKLPYFTGAATMAVTDFPLEAREYLAVKGAGSGQLSNLGLGFSVAGSALTVALKQADGATDATATSPVIVGMRDPTLASGKFFRRKASAALSLTVPSGATLGQANATAASLYVYLIDNGGTLELAVSGNDYGENGRVSTTVMDTSSDLAAPMYSASARSNVAFRKIAACVNTQTTAGTWAAVPSTAQLAPFAAAESEAFKAIKVGASALAILAALGGVPVAGDEFAGLGSFRNRIINGNFSVWQRGTSFTDPAGNSYDADRTRSSYGGTGGSLTVSRQTHTLGQTDVPGNPKYFRRYAQLAAGSGSAVTNIYAQRIEGVGTFAGKTVTLTCYAKAAVGSPTLTPIINQVFGTGGSPSTAVNNIGSASATLTTTWTKYQWVIALASISGKTLGSNGDDYVDGILRSSLNNAIQTVDISRVSLVLGDATAEADPFAPRPHQQELALCQRYYSKSFPIDTAPAQGVVSPRRVGAALSTGLIQAHAVFPVTMRVSPTITFYKPDNIAGTSGMWQWFDTSAYQTASAMGTPVQNENEFSSAMTISSGTSKAAYAITGHWAADAEL